MAISRTTSRAICGADSIHKGRRKGAGTIFSPLRHSTIIMSLNCLSFLVHPGSFLSFQSYCSLDSSYSSSPLLGIIWSYVYSFSALWAPETAAPHQVLDALQFWMPSSFGCPPVLDALQFWMPSSSGCPPVLDALQFWMPSSFGCPPVLDALQFWMPSSSGCPPVLDALQFWMPSSFGCPPVLDALIQYWLLYYRSSVGHLSTVEIPNSKRGIIK